MNKNFIKDMEEKLEDSKEETEKTIESLSDRIKNDEHISIATNHSQVSNHPADVGTELFEKEMDIALINRQRDTAEQIEGALERIDEGNYGKCEECSRSIETQRLEILPYTNVCASCAKENNNSHYERSMDYINDATLENFYNMYEDMLDSGEYYDDEQLITLQEPNYLAPGCVEAVEGISNQQYKNQLY